MQRVIIICVIFVCVNSVMIDKHSSHLISSPPNATARRMLRTPPFIPVPLQQNSPPSPETSDALEMPLPPPEVELPPRFVNSPSIPVDYFGRPLIFPGTSSYHPLPKCCPRGYQLDDGLQRCVQDESGRVTHGLTLMGNEAAKLKCDFGNQLRLGSVEAARYVRQLMDQRLSLTVQGENKTTEVVLSAGDFCADAASGPFGPFALFLCPCEYTTCVRKCCPQGKSLAVDELTITQVKARCEAPPDEEFAWEPRIESATTDVDEEVLGPKDQRKGFAVLERSWPAGCPTGLTRGPPSWAPAKSGSDFMVFYNGLAIVMTDPPIVTYNYCVDSERRSSGLLVESIVFCAQPLEVPPLDGWLSALGILGALALLATIVVHSVLPEMRATPFGRALMSYAATHLSVAVVGLSWTLAPNIGRVRCIFTMLWSQYFQLASAFWLNVMCYDMGIAFRSFQGPLDRMGAVATRRFIHYSQYAWGCPFVVTVTMLCLQFTHPPGHPWRPIEYFLMCNYSSKPHYLFLYVPTLILLLINLAQFVWITCRIRFLQKDSAILTEDEESPESSPYPTRKRLLLFLKLLWVMGVFESLLEISVWATSSELAYWHIANVVDMSRSLSIFALSVCKPRIIRRLRDRLCCGFCLPKNRVAPSDGVRTTNTSSGTSGTEVSGNRTTGIASYRNTAGAGNRRTNFAGNRNTNDSSSRGTGFAGNGSKDTVENPNRDIQSTTDNTGNVGNTGNRSPNVRINPFSEPFSPRPIHLGDGTNAIFTDYLNKSTDVDTSTSKASDTMNDQIVLQEKVDQNDTLKVSPNETMIGKKSDPDSEPNGPVEMRVISTTSL